MCIYCRKPAAVVDNDIASKSAVKSGGCCRDDLSGLERVNIIGSIMFQVASVECDVVILVVPGCVLYVYIIAFQRECSGFYQFVCAFLVVIAVDVVSVENFQNSAVAVLDYLLSEKRSGVVRKLVAGGAISAYLKVEMFLRAPAGNAGVRDDLSSDDGLTLVDCDISQRRVNSRKTAAVIDDDVVAYAVVPTAGINRDDRAGLERVHIRAGPAGVLSEEVRSPVRAALGVAVKNRAPRHILAVQRKLTADDELIGFLLVVLVAGGPHAFFQHISDIFVETCCSCDLMRGVLFKAGSAELREHCGRLEFISSVFVETVDRPVQFLVEVGYLKGLPVVGKRPAVGMPVFKLYADIAAIYGIASAEPCLTPGI